jgi:hypothetical protein
VWVIWVGVAVVGFLLRIYVFADNLGAGGGIVADCRRSWTVTVLWLVCFGSTGLTGILLAADGPRWRVVLPLVVSVVTFVYANLLGERLGPSPLYRDRYPEKASGRKRP